MDKKIMLQLLQNKTGEIQSLLEHFKNTPNELEEGISLLSDRIEGLSKEFEILKANFNSVNEIVQEERIVSKEPVISNPEIKEEAKVEIVEEIKVKIEEELIAPVSIHNEKIEESSTLNDQLQSSGSEIIGEKIYSNSITDIRSAIGINDRFLFIRELFNNDNDKYNSTIEFINNAADFGIVEEQFKLNQNWDFENPTVVQFLEITKRKF